MGFTLSRDSYVRSQIWDFKRGKIIKIGISLWLLGFFWVFFFAIRLLDPRALTFNELKNRIKKAKIYILGVKGPSKKKRTLPWGKHPATSRNLNFTPWNFFLYILTFWAETSNLKLVIIQPPGCLFCKNCPDFWNYNISHPIESKITQSGVNFQFTLLNFKF